MRAGAHDRKKGVTSFFYHVLLVRVSGIWVDGTAAVSMSFINFNV